MVWVLRHNFTDVEAARSLDATRRDFMLCRRNLKQRGNLEGTPTSCHLDVHGLNNKLSWGLGLSPVVLSRTGVTHVREATESD